ncbi:hypothetical protein [Minwuia sp.]|uniref:hypothetical protein n=1 Tax=Minwuia sp. TaxID=2493630 RepID=UPI003A8E15D3
MSFLSRAAGLACLAGVAAVAAFPAAAQQGKCPEPGANSFSVVRDQPFIKADVQRDGSQIMVKTTSVVDGKTSQVQTRFDRGLLPVIRADQSGLIRQSFGPIPDDFWSFTVGQEISVPVTVDMRGQEKFEGTHRITVESIRTLAVGDCEYDVAMLLQDTDLGFTRLVFRQAYSPRLGFVLAAQRIDPANGETLSFVSYDRIEAQ